jgi:hypothetical protein
VFAGFWRSRARCWNRITSHSHSTRRNRMYRLLHRSQAFSAALGLLLVLSSSAALAQYQVTYLTSDLTGKAKFQDKLLKNPWGLAYSPDAPFWISDAASGYSTLYTATGDPQSLQVVVPPATGTGPGSSRSTPGPRHFCLPLSMERSADGRISNLTTR